MAECKALMGLAVKGFASTARQPGFDLACCILYWTRLDALLICTSSSLRL